MRPPWMTKAALAAVQSPRPRGTWALTSSSRVIDDRHVPGAWISPAVALLLLGVLTGCGSDSTNPDQEASVTAIDIALEPDSTMIDRAGEANARLRSVYPAGFALDEAHHPHITMLQRFVRTADLDKVYAAADTVLASEKPATWKLTAFRYYYIPSPPDGLAGIVIVPTDDLRRLQQRLIDAIAPYTEKTGTVDAFVSTEQGRDIQQSLIDYVANFVPNSSGTNSTRTSPSA